MAMKLTRWSKTGCGQNKRDPCVRLTARASALRNGVGRTIAFAALFWISLAVPASAGGPDSQPAYKVLPPILRGNLAIFPVVANQSFDASQLMTLDEGVRSGQVIVTEAGDERGLVRPGQPIPRRQGGAEVNRLVLYNSSSHPLLLLAGEIVTGGKQDRVIGSDRIVPANTGPIDLGVFCVEPGRWVASSGKFGSMGAQMAQPSVRTPAMAERNQNQVWANVRASNAKMASNLSSADAASVTSTSSYAKVFDSAPVAKIEATYGGQDSEQAILRELRSKGAAGVVVGGYSRFDGVRNRLAVVGNAKGRRRRQGERGSCRRPNQTDEAERAGSA